MGGLVEHLTTLEHTESGHLGAVLKRSTAQERFKAIGKLDALPPLALAQHATALRAALDDIDERVRKAADDCLNRAGASIFCRKYGAAPNAGVLSFAGTDHEAKFLTVADTTSGALVADYMRRHWGLAPPDLLLSVTGGARDFALSDQLKKAVGEGLRCKAKASRLMMITGGTDTGVMRLMGTLCKQGGVDAPLIGFVPLGVVTGRQTFDGNTDPERRCYYSVSSSAKASAASAPLNPRHTHFVLVDSGQVAEEAWGDEIPLRVSMEESMGQVPEVLMSLQGGIGTLTTMLKSMQACTRLVLIKGSGGVTDFMIEVVRHGLSPELMERFGYSDDKQVQLAAAEIKRLYDKSDGALITIFGVNEDDTELDTCDLSYALSPHLSAKTQAMRANRMSAL